MIAFLRKRYDNHALGMAAAWFAVAVCAFGCIGGSGSSGFDLAESAAIQRVGQGQECEEFDGLILCPADATRGAEPTPTQPTPPPVATPSATETTNAPGSPTPEVTGTIPLPQGTPTPTPLAQDTAAPAATPTHTPRGIRSATPSPTAIPETDVLTNAPGLDEGAACAPTSLPATCVVEFRFRANGLPESSAFRVAARPADAEGPWSILVPTRVAGAGGEFEYTTETPIDLAQGDPNAIQLVVLVFDSDPGPVPDRVSRLSDTGADRAFVAAVVPIAFH